MVFKQKPHIVAVQQKIPQADITVNLFVRNFPKFDVIKGEFIADMTVQFEFDARQISIDRLKDFAFENAEILKKSEPQVQLAKDTVVVSYDVRVLFNTAFDYHNFPFDGHRFFMTLIPRGITPAEALFAANREGFMLNKALNTASWICVGRQVFVGYAQEKLEKRGGSQLALYPRVQFSLDFARDGMRHVLSLLVPMLLIFFVSLFSFTFDPLGFENSSIISISILSVTALIGYRFVIDNMSPQTGYFMISDQLFLLFMFISCLVFFINIFSARLNKYIKSAITCLLHLLIIGTIVYLTW